MLIMTSNIGARYLQRRSHLGFQSAAEGTSERKAEDMVMAEVKRLFNPEFLNRLDEVIVFNALTDNDLVQILDLLVAQMNQNLEHKNIRLPCPERRASGFWKRLVRTVPMGLVRCAGRSRSTLKTRFRKR